MTPRDLLLSAGYLLQLATAAQGADPSADRLQVRRERAAIGAAARGLLDPTEAFEAPLALFTTPARELAWLSARQAVLVLGPRAAPHHARRALGSVPQLIRERAVFLQLVSDAEEELDLSLQTPAGARSLQTLTRHARGRLALDLARPALERLQAGAATPSLARALRDAADLIDPPHDAAADTETEAA